MSERDDAREARMHELLYSNEGRVEQCERICELEDIARGMLDAFRLGYASGEGIDRVWCRDLYDTYKRRLSEVGQ
mgnify:CR=1 FL=1